MKSFVLVLASLAAAAFSLDQATLIEMVKSNDPGLQRLSLAEVNEPYEDSSAALLIACVYGTDSQVQAFLKQGANPNLMNNRGYTPLEYCVEKGRQGGVKALLAAGANPNLRHSYYDHGPALFAALTDNQTDMIKQLLAHGADLALSNHDGTTALLHAACKCPPATIQLLLDAKASLTAVDDDGMDAVGYAKMCKNKPAEAFLKKRLGKAK